MTASAAKNEEKEKEKTMKRLKELTDTSSISSALAPTASSALNGQPSDEEESVNEYADNEDSVGRVADNEDSVGRVADNEDSVSRVADNEDSVSRVADIEDSVGRVADIEDSVCRVADNEDSVGRVADSEDSVSRVADNEDSVSRVADNEDSVSRRAAVEDVDATTGTLKDIEVVSNKQIETKVSSSYREQERSKEQNDEREGRNGINEINTVNSKQGTKDVPISSSSYSSIDENDSNRTSVNSIERSGTMECRKHLKYTRFLQRLNTIDSHRDYTIIIDRSASMSLRNRWKSAEDAVKLLSDAVCRCHSDGFTLYFFSSRSQTTHGEIPPFRMYPSVKSSDEVMEKFASKENRPKGGTDLTTVLKDACSKRIDGKPLSILIITDGIPDNQESSEKLIVQVGNNLNDPEELNITMVQVGDDSKADDYLNTLDTKLGPMGAMYDIVDCVPYKNLQGAGEFADQLREALATGADTSLLLPTQENKLNHSLSSSSSSSSFIDSAVAPLYVEATTASIKSDEDSNTIIRSPEEDTVKTIIVGDTNRDSREDNIKTTLIEDDAMKDSKESVNEESAACTDKHSAIDKSGQVKLLTVRFLINLYPHAIFASSGSWIHGVNGIESEDDKKEKAKHINELYTYITKNIFALTQTPISKWHRLTSKMDASSSLIGQKELNYLRALYTGFHCLQYVSFHKLYKKSRIYDGFNHQRSYQLSKAFKKLKIQRGLLSRGFWECHRSIHVFSRFRAYVKRMKLERGEISSSESSDSSVALSEEEQTHMMEDMNLWEQQDNDAFDDVEEAEKGVEEAEDEKVIMNSDEIGEIEVEDDDMVVYKEEEEEEEEEETIDGIENKMLAQQVSERQEIIQSHPTMGLTIQTEDFTMVDAVEDYLKLSDLALESNDDYFVQQNDLFPEQDGDENGSNNLTRIPTIDEISERHMEQTTVQVLNDLASNIGNICSSPYFKQKISEFEFEEKEKDEERERKLQECVINLSKRHAANKIALALQNWRQASYARRMNREEEEMRNKSQLNPYRLVVDELLPSDSEAHSPKMTPRTRSSSFGTPVSRVSFLDYDEVIESSSLSVKEMDQFVNEERESSLTQAEADEESLAQQENENERLMEEKRRQQELEEDRIFEEQRVELIRGIVEKLKKQRERAEAEERARLELEEMTRQQEERKMKMEWERQRLAREAKRKRDQEELRWKRQIESERQRRIQQEEEGRQLRIQEEKEELERQKEAERLRQLEQDEIARKALEEIHRAEEATRRKEENERRMEEERRRVAEEQRRSRLLHLVVDHFSISGSYQLLYAFTQWLRFPTAEEEMIRVKSNLGQLDELITDVSGMMNVISPMPLSSQTRQERPFNYEDGTLDEEPKEVSFRDLNNSLDELNKSINVVSHTADLLDVQVLDETPAIPIIIGRSDTGTPLPWLNRPDDESNAESPRPSHSDSPARLAKFKALQWEIETLNVPHDRRRDNNDEDEKEKDTSPEYYYDDADGRSGYLSAYINDTSIGLGDNTSPEELIEKNLAFYSSTTTAAGNDINNNDCDGTISLSGDSNDSSIRIMSEVDVSSLLNESFEENQDRAIEYTHELHLRAERAVRRIEELEKSLVKGQQTAVEYDDNNNYDNLRNFDIILDPDPDITGDREEMDSVEESSLSSGSNKSEEYDYQAEEIAAYRPSDNIILASTDFDKFNTSRHSVLAEISEEVQDIRTALGIRSETLQKVPTPPRSAIKTRSRARQQQIDRVRTHEKQQTGNIENSNERRSRRLENLRSTGRTNAPFTPER